MYRKITNLTDNDYEFVPSTAKREKGINKEKRIIRKVFPQSIPRRVKGFFIPKYVAGPNPSVIIDFERGTIEVNGNGLSPTTFIPQGPEDYLEEGEEIGMDEETDEKIVDRLLSGLPNDKLIVPLSKHGDLRKIGGGDKKYVKQKLLDWIEAYGWTTAPPTGKHAGKEDHLMSEWFDGFKVIA